jgi:hypothetical protein
VELLVAALVVLGFAAIFDRFLARDGGGHVLLPRVIDESLGMWAIRQLTGGRRSGAGVGATVDPAAAPGPPKPATAAPVRPRIGVGRAGAWVPPDAAAGSPRVTRMTVVADPDTASGTGELTMADAME